MASLFLASRSTASRTSALRPRSRGSAPRPETDWACAVQACARGEIASLGSPAEGGAGAGAAGATPRHVALRSLLLFLGHLERQARRLAPASPHRAALSGRFRSTSAERPPRLCAQVFNGYEGSVSLPAASASSQKVRAAQLTD